MKNPSSQEFGGVAATDPDVAECLRRAGSDGVVGCSKQFRDDERRSVSASFSASTMAGAWTIVFLQRSLPSRLPSPRVTN
jgi:hypothetical protein